MSEYRVCKNEFGFYKIQEWIPPLRLGKFLLFRGKWKDRCFDGFTNKLKVFALKEEAEDKIKDYIYDEKKNNKNWTCDSPYNEE